jgi:hypothetical protein
MAAPDTAHRGWRPLPVGRRGRAAAGDRMPGPAQGRRSVRGGQCRPEVRTHSRRRQDGRTAQRPVSAATAAHRTPVAAGGRPQTQRTPPCCGTVPPQRSGRTVAQLRRGRPARRNPEAPRSPACRPRPDSLRAWPRAGRSVLLAARRRPSGPRGDAGDKAVTPGTIVPFLSSGHSRHRSSAASLA